MGRAIHRPPYWRSYGGRIRLPSPGRWGLERIWAIYGYGVVCAVFYRILRPYTAVNTVTTCVKFTLLIILNPLPQAQKYYICNLIENTWEPCDSLCAINASTCCVSANTSITQAFSPIHHTCRKSQKSPIREYNALKGHNSWETL